MFITLEGPEGSGKSTHAMKLKSFLEGKGHKVVVTHEPGGTQTGKQIREMLLHPEATVDQMTEVFLFAADRAEHVNKIIMPALREGKVVVCDRFIDSTVAYQCGARGLPEDLVRYLNMVSAAGLIPDLTLLLDISPELGIKRAAIKGPEDRFEKEKIDFHKKVRNKYLEIAKQDAKRVRVVNTEEKDIDDVQNDLRILVEGYLNEK